MVKSHVLIAELVLLCSILAIGAGNRYRNLQSESRQQQRTDAVQTHGSTNYGLHQQVVTAYRNGNTMEAHNLITSQLRCRDDIKTVITTLASEKPLVALIQFCKEIKPLQKALVALDMLEDRIRNKNEFDHMWHSVELAKVYVKEDIRNGLQGANVLLKVAQVNKKTAVHLMEALTLDIINGVFYNSEQQWRQQVMYMLRGINDVFALVKCERTLFEAVPQPRALLSRLKMLSIIVKLNNQVSQTDLELVDKVVKQLNAYLNSRDLDYDCNQSQQSGLAQCELQ